jgi:hypothetical protein
MPQKEFGSRDGPRLPSLRGSIVPESARFTCPFRIGPFLTIMTRRRSIRTMVDPTRLGDRPPSTTASILSPRHRKTIFALVQGGYPARFALVPVSRPPHLSISLNAALSLGHLTAIVFRPRVSELGNRTLGLSTNVSGPGQNLEVNALAWRSITAIRSATAGEVTRIGKGFFRFPLTAITRFTAREFLGSHPKP